jgi:hypothetical protein
VKLSETMRYHLYKIRDKGGSLEFTSGWPTYDALEKRGLVSINHVKGYKYRVTITEAGSAALVR